VLPFAVNAGTLGIAMLLLLTLPSVFGATLRDPEDQGSRSALASVRRDLGEGMRWLWRHPDVRDVTIFAGVASAMDGAWFAVLVLYVVQVLQQRPGAYGLLLAIATLGGIIAGGTGASVTRRLGPWRSLVAAGLVMAVTQAVLGLSGSVVISAAMLFASSGAWALFNMTAVTMRQRQVPDGLLGRVASLYGTVTRGAEALGAIAGGALAATAGIRAPMLAGAVPVAAVTAVLAWRYRPGHQRPS
jgi:predicted MFS family arabinose efflux permease